MATTKPSGIGKHGGKFWEEIAGSFNLRPDELRILEDACREVDLIERIAEELETADLLTMGSMGQLVTSPLVTEIRQHRALLARLLGQLKLPDESGQSRGAADRSTSARAAAVARWGKRGA